MTVSERSTTCGLRNSGGGFFLLKRQSVKCEETYLLVVSNITVLYIHLNIHTSVHECIYATALKDLKKHFEFAKYFIEEFSKQ